MGCAARRIIAPVLALLLLLGLDALPAVPQNPAGAIAAAAGHPSHRHLRAEAAAVRGEAGWTLDTETTRRLERECTAELCHGRWFDGARSFAFGINGTPLHDRQRDDRAERTFAAIASTAFAEPEFLSGGGRVTPLPADGAQLRYRVSALDGAELVAVAGLPSRRLEAVERPDGSPYARLIASGTAPAVVYGARTYDRVTAVAETLHAPAGPEVSATEPHTLELSAGVLPIVPCRLAEQAATCLIDSGTTPSAITLAFAERIGREPRGAIEISGLRNYTTGVVDAGPLVLDGARFGATHFAVVPHVRGAAFDVIVGSDVLAELQVELEPSRRRARIAVTGLRSSDPAVALDFDAGLPYAQVRLANGAAAESMLLDTGDGGAVSIGYDTYRTDMNLFAVRGHSVAGGATAVAMDTVDGELPHVDVGPVRFDRVPISAVRGQHQGHLGYGLAARCARFVLDLGAERFECRPIQPVVPEPPRRQE